MIIALLIIALFVLLMWCLAIWSRVSQLEASMYELNGLMNDMRAELDSRERLGGM